MEKLLEMKNITKSFNGVTVLHNVDFSLDKGEVVALCGENGAGKSTLVKILMGIYSKDSGEVLFTLQKWNVHDTSGVQPSGSAHYLPEYIPWKGDQEEKRIP